MTVIYGFRPVSVDKTVKSVFKNKNLRLFFTKLIISVSLFGLFTYYDVPPKEVSNMEVSNWNQFISKEGRFSIAFPCEPQVEKDTVAVPNSSKTLPIAEYRSSDNGDITFAVSHLDIPSMWCIASTKRILAEAAKQYAIFIGNGAVLQNSQYTTYLGHKAMDISVVQGDKVTDGVIFLKGNRIYMISTQRVASADIESVREHFYKSFNLV